jgi:phosphate:Na+ symporter
MKTSTESAANLIQLDAFGQQPMLVYFILGTVITAITQSSSATMIMTLSAINAGLLPLENAAALIIGADLGTTSTVILGALKGHTVKRRVASVHFIFNLVTDLIALASIPLLLLLVNDIYQISDPLFALVAIHSSFNLVGVALFLPLINQLESLSYRLFPERKELELAIDNISPSLNKTALSTIEYDIKSMIINVLKLNANRLNINPINLNHNYPHFKYNELKKNESKLSDFILDVQRLQSDRNTIKQSHHFIISVREAMYAAKAIKDIEHNINEILNDSNKQVAHSLTQLLMSTEIFYQKIADMVNSNKPLTDYDIARLTEVFVQSHQLFNDMIYQFIDDGRIAHSNASSALNVNRELLLSGHSMVNSVVSLANKTSHNNGVYLHDNSHKINPEGPISNE